MSASEEAATIQAMENMLSALHLHLQYLQEEVAPGWLSPATSDNSLFLYRSRDDGTIRTQQDAMFMCESIIVIAKPMAPTFAVGTGPTATTEMRSLLRLSIVDVGPGRYVTQATSAKRDVQRPTGAAFTSTADTGVDVMVPTTAFVPLWNNIPFQPADYNYDHFYRLSALWPLPRGAVVRIQFFDKFNVDEDMNEEAAGILPRVVLCGHKVYG